MKIKFCHRAEFCYFLCEYIKYISFGEQRFEALTPRCMLAYVDIRLTQCHYCINYADDVTLLASTGMALNAMLHTCRLLVFADAHNLLFNLVTIIDI